MPISPETSECWYSLTRRLLGYFAKPFNIQTPKNRLDRLMAAIARELSGCTETVTLTDSNDARGDGAFQVIARFGPISAVTSVKRVDANGSVLETYTVSGFAENVITVTGTHAPGHGDRLSVSYSYLFGGLEYQVKQALLELNILTATGSFLDSWGRWFGVVRQAFRFYGSETYGESSYGTSGRESDTHYSRRIIDRVTISRNTPNAVVAAIERVTGVPVQLVEWSDSASPTGWIFKPSALSEWDGGSSAASLSKHLVWGRTARFTGFTVSGGGACTFEVWIPPTALVPLGRLLAVAVAYKAAGIRVFIRPIPTVAPPPEAPSGLSVSE